jgi:hypothetical protein
VKTNKKKAGSRRGRKDEDEQQDSDEELDNWLMQQHAASMSRTLLTRTLLDQTNFARNDDDAFARRFGVGECTHPQVLPLLRVWKERNSGDGGGVDGEEIGPAAAELLGALQAMRRMGKPPADNFS